MMTRTKNYYLSALKFELEVSLCAVWSWTGSSRVKTKLKPSFYNLYGFIERSLVNRDEII